jgi:hypothetical protein
MKESTALIPPVWVFTLFFIGCVTITGQLNAQSTPKNGEQVISAKNTSKSNLNPAVDTLPLNQVVLDVLHHMPAGGGYSVKREATVALRSAVNMLPLEAGSGLYLEPELAKPSFCSGATYLVFLQTIETLIAQNKLQVSSEVLRALLVSNQSDGEGVWGRWNANGPGTARLFYELGLGRNFSSLDAARPGDFMKIFWTSEIGCKEAGHSVVYLGHEQSAKGEMIRFWSSNLGVGFSEKEVPLARINRVLISRLEDPNEIKNVLSIPKKDDYLAAMLTCSCSPELMLAMVGVKNQDSVVPYAASPSKIDGSLTSPQ